MRRSALPAACLLAACLFLPAQVVRAEWTLEVTAPSGLVVRDKPSTSGKALLVLTNGETFVPQLYQYGPCEVIGGRPGIWLRLCVDERIASTNAWVFSAHARSFHGDVERPPEAGEQSLAGDVPWSSFTGLRLLPGKRCVFRTTAGQDIEGAAVTHCGQFTLIELSAAARARAPRPLSASRWWIGIPFFGGNEHSPFYREGIRFYACESGADLWFYEPVRVHQDTGLRLDGIDALAVGGEGRQSVTVDDVVLRDKPAATARPVQWRAPDGRTLGYVAKGTRVTVWATSKDKVKVKQWENHWLFVEVPPAAPGGQRLYGWMYGEFVKAAP